MVANIIYAVIFAALWRFRGNDMLPKYLATTLMGVLVGGALTYGGYSSYVSYNAMVVYIIGAAIAASEGWPELGQVIHGWLADKSKWYYGFAQWIYKKFLDKDGVPDNNTEQRQQGLVRMCVRHLMWAPMFVTLGFIVGQYVQSFIVGAAASLVGVIYWLSGFLPDGLKIKGWSVKGSEMVAGAYIWTLTYLLIF